MNLKHLKQLYPDGKNIGEVLRKSVSVKTPPPYAPDKW